MLMTILVIAAVVLGFLAFVSSRPDQFRVQRSTRIRAAPEAIYPLIEDFHRWKEWSPYEKLDPAMLRTYSGAAKGKGAVYEWKGNEKAGAGRMEILEMTPPSKLVIKLDFLKPFEGHNTAEFDLRPAGETTEVTWAVHGPSPFIAKLMSLVFSMDKLLGKDFEAGLANLKAASET
ncbi:MAG: SRPBCC family protein [Phenylobacterium sp.]